MPLVLLQLNLSFGETLERRTKYAGEARERETHIVAPGMLEYGLALAMSQHQKLGASSSLALLELGTLANMFELVRDEAAKEEEAAAKKAASKRRRQRRRLIEVTVNFVCEDHERDGDVQPSRDPTPAECLLTPEILRKIEEDPEGMLAFRPDLLAIAEDAGLLYKTTLEALAVAQIKQDPDGMRAPLIVLAGHAACLQRCCHMIHATREANCAPLPPRDFVYKIYKYTFICISVYLLVVLRRCRTWKCCG